MNVCFNTALIVERLDRSWKLHQNFIVFVNDDPIIVPKGFVTDFASVPRLPLAYYLGGGRGVKSATLHDYLYDQQKPRAWADDVFYHALISEGEPEVIAKAMFVAVRAGGGAHYDKGIPLEVATADWPPA